MFGCGHARPARGVAHKTVTEVTGLRLPHGTSICFGQGVDKYSQRTGDCKPRSSGDSWVRARRTQPYDKLPTAGQIKYDSSELKRAIAEHYLARPHYRDGSVTSSCTDWTFFSDASVQEDIYSPTTTTDLTEVYRDRAVDVAVAMLKAHARANGVRNRARLTADFAAHLHKIIEREAKSSAKIVYIQTNWNGGARSMLRHPQLAGCLVEATRDAELITGIGGIITFGLHTDVRVYEAMHFEHALRLAVQAEQDDFAEVVGASLSIQWEHAINREIQSHVRQESEQPVFHPLWVQTEQIKPKVIEKARETYEASKLAREQSIGQEDGPTRRSWPSEPGMIGRYNVR